MIYTSSSNFPHPFCSFPTIPPTTLSQNHYSRYFNHFLEPAYNHISINFPLYIFLRLLWKKKIIIFKQKYIKRNNFWFGIFSWWTRVYEGSEYFNAICMISLLGVDHTIRVVWRVRILEVQREFTKYILHAHDQMLATPGGSRAPRIREKRPFMVLVCCGRTTR